MSDTRYTRIGGTGTFIGTHFEFDGTIKFVKITNHLLTPDQIKAKYNKIASAVDLQVLKNGLLPDQRVYTAGQRIEV